MIEPTDANTVPGIPTALLVAASQDRIGEQRRLGINTIDYKVTSQDSTGLLIAEITSRAKGGPERHLHVMQMVVYVPLGTHWVHALLAATIVSPSKSIRKEGSHG